MLLLSENLIWKKRLTKSIDVDIKDMEMKSCSILILERVCKISFSLAPFFTKDLGTW